MSAEMSEFTDDEGSEIECAACAEERAEEFEIAKLRLSVAQIDWYRLAGTVGVHPDDMRRFKDGEASLTAPARERVRRALEEKSR